MQSKAKTVNDYLSEIPAERAAAFSKLRQAIKKNIPKGFAEQMSYGMIGYVVPLKTFPAGYHCNPSLPLPFVNLGSQKNYIIMHHMGLYGNPELLKWFQTEYPKHSKLKLDMGKGCIRFKKPDQIPFELIAELMKKITVEKWINYTTKAWRK
jgi:uncharacterized protein YdhG (YjbR/CyaY superfamily)